MGLPRTLVPVSALPAADVQAQATLQTRLDKGYFSKSVTPLHTQSRHMRLTGVLKVCNTNGDDRVGAVVVDLVPDQHQGLQALQHAERKARTYGKALLGLASLLCLSVCGNLASSALSILVSKESRFSDAIPREGVCLFACAAVPFCLLVCLEASWSSVGWS